MNSTIQEPKLLMSSNNIEKTSDIKQGTQGGEEYENNHLDQQSINIPKYLEIQALLTEVRAPKTQISEMSPILEEVV